MLLLVAHVWECAGFSSLYMVQLLCVCLNWLFVFETHLQLVICDHYITVLQHRVPSPRELIVHTQNIMQSALIKKKLEEQRENFRKRQEMQQ